MDTLFKSLIQKEQERQNTNIELIASENFVSQDILDAMGSILTNNYAEGYPGKRYYGGCQWIDEIEKLCQQEWKKVFNTQYEVNVQPHSGSQANYAAYMALLKPGDTILSMDLNHGGHLTHGSAVNFSGKLYNMIFYGIDKNGFIDFNDVEEKAKIYHPRLILAGASAYPRMIDFSKFYTIAKEYGAYFMVDMAHIAGLIAARVHNSPFGLADIITTTTHKTLRGPRGGLIFCKPEFYKKVNSAIFPGSQGGPLEHIIAAKGICAKEAQTPEYDTYIRNVVNNCTVFCDAFKNMGYKIVTDGTDNHLFLIDLSDTNLTGLKAQELCDEHNITLNKNCVPNEKRSPMITSGVRIGTAAMTTKGYTPIDFINVAKIIDSIWRPYL